MKLHVLIAVQLLSMMTTVTSVTSSDDGSQKLMLILFDGFRWDYVEKYDLSNFKRFYSKGANGGRTISSYPTLSLPNYYSIITGLYTESHGMTGNYMYDTVSGEEFLLAENLESKNLRWWEGGMPLWVSVQKQGKKAYMFYWTGPELPIFGTHPEWYVNYSASTEEILRIATVDGLAVLRNGSADFVGIYYGKPDNAGHESGPDSDNVKGQLAAIDRVMGDLLDDLEGGNGEEKVNLMVVSDHGMTSINRTNFIDLSPVLTPDLYVSIQEKGDTVTIYLRNTSQQDEVYNKLVNLSSHMTVYKQQDIPERLHYKRGQFVADILCMADLHWFLAIPTEPGFQTFMNGTKQQDVRGGHGYDNKWDDMAGIFYAMGPYFKEGSSVETINNVDLYEVMCRILAITPRPNNGTIQHMTPLLATSSAQHLTLSTHVLGLFLAIVLCIR